MAFLSNSVDILVPYSISDCFSAMKDAIETLSKFSINAENETLGTMQINVAPGLTSYTFGDIVTVAISESENGKSKVHIDSTAKVPSLLASKQQSKNIQLLSDSFSKSLEKYTPREINPSNISNLEDKTIESRLQRLSDLHGKHLISDEEYEKKRAEILSVL